MTEADGDARPVMVEREASRPAEPGPAAGSGLMLAQYQGPLPPAAEFEKYERALPGAADR
ncbi:MAG: hypothetical protein JNJ47_08895, partial [Alphaproteobacteria bacterium]|nr:hypothetical protein [Alphaproteobacteria bacterium]